jgi:hypothetical protein
MTRPHHIPPTPHETLLDTPCASPASRIASLHDNPSSSHTIPAEVARISVCQVFRSAFGNSSFHGTRRTKRPHACTTRVGFNGGSSCRVKCTSEIFPWRGIMRSAIGFRSYCTGGFFRLMSSCWLPLSDFAPRLFFLSALLSLRLRDI